MTIIVLHTAPEKYKGLQLLLWQLPLWQLPLWQMALWQIWCVHLSLWEFAWRAIMYWVQFESLHFEVLGYINLCKFPFVQSSVLANNRLEFVCAGKCPWWQMSIVANNLTANWLLHFVFMQLSVTPLGYACILLLLYFHLPFLITASRWNLLE